MENVYVNDFNNTVQTYYKELKKYKPLTREQEIDLFKKAKCSDQMARDTILSSNLKFVFDVAKKYKGRGVDLEDLISEGNIGLTKAFEKFDETRNIRFISYAVWWIKQSIQDCIRKRGIVTSIETYEDDSLKQNITNHNISDEEDESVTKGEVMLSSGEDDEKREMNLIHKKIIKKLLVKLSPRARYIVSSYYGLDDNEEMTLEEIGDVLHLSKERVRQIKLSALKIMRSEILLTDYSDLSL